MSFANGTAYRYMAPDDRMLMAKHGAPVPPSSLSLLESSGGHKDGQRAMPRSMDPRSSLLLDANDELGMQLLVSSATVDCQDYKVLSFEEVERLKREQSLLANRIDSHTRKLALESKVRDASQNLVRLHANSNKRLSKQAEEQLTNATRKVDDLATDLWRLQRRESTIRQQLLEHFAGILARNVIASEHMRKNQAYLDFDEKHLYEENSTMKEDFSQVDGRDSFYHSSGVKSNIQESVMRAESRLRETNRQLRKFLSSKASQQDEDDENEHHLSSAGGLDLDTQITKLDSTLLAFQEQHLEQKERNLRAMENQHSLLKRLWNRVGSGRSDEYTDAALERKITEILQEQHSLQSQILGANSRTSERHAQQLESTQNEYEQRLSRLQAELDDTRDNHSTLMRDLTNKTRTIEQHVTKINSYETRANALQQELLQAQSHVEQLVSRDASVRSVSSADKDLIERLEGQNSDLHEASINASAVFESELMVEKEKTDEANAMIQQLRNEQSTMTNQLRSTSRKLEDLKHELDQLRSQRESQASELREQQTMAEQRIASLAAKRDQAVAQIEFYKNELNNMQSELQQAHSTVAELESSAREFKSGEHENLISVLQQELVSITTQNTVVKADLEKLRGSTVDKEKAQYAAAKDGLVRQLDARIETLEVELSNLRSHNADLEVELSETRSFKAVTAPLPISKASSEREQMLEATSQLLQTELDGLLVEYELITRSAFLYENERTKAETRMDELLERVIELESQVSDEKVKNLGLLQPSEERSAAEGGGKVIEPPSTATLRKEFRRLVQEMRSDHAKQTRDDYTEIKKLERQLADAAHQSVALHGGHRRASSVSTAAAAAGAAGGGVVAAP